MDPNYDPRMTLVRKKPLCMVKIDPTSTVKKLQRKVQDICSKGAGECRHSNARITGKLNLLSSLSPRLPDPDTQSSVRMYNGSSVDSGSVKPGSQMMHKHRSPAKPSRISGLQTPRLNLESALGSQDGTKRHKRTAMQQPPSSDQRSSSLIQNDSSLMRESTMSRPGRKSTALNKGDRVRQQTMNTVVKGSLEQIGNDVIADIQHYHGELKQVQAELKKIKDARYKQEQSLEALDGEELAEAKAKIKASDQTA